jgi:outer membrane murein-binding lipoprotein Lpp
MTNHPRRIMKISQLTTALLFGVTLSAPLHASDERLNRLESEVRDLRSRIEKLEGGNKAQLTSPSPKAKNKEGWKELSNWRSLKKGMSYDDVRGLLGEPERISGGTITHWFYPNAGRVVYYDDRLDHWSEPRLR